MINGMRIRQARELSRLTQAELAAEVGVAQTTIAHIEGGRFQPSADVVVALARRLGVPEEFFRRDDPPTFPQGTLLFRGHANLVAADITEAQKYGELSFEAAALMSKRVRNRITLSVPQLSEEPYTPASAALFTRGALGIAPDMPIPRLVRVVEQAGVWVFALPMRLEGRDAYCLWTGATNLWSTVELRRPVMLISGGVPTDRFRWNIAHELGHLVMHQAIRGTSKELEDQANQFAAEFLLPEAAMREEMTPPVTLMGLAALKPRWRVSIQALIKRARELEIISTRQYTYLHEQLRARGWKTQEPVELPPELEKPRALRRMAEVVYGDPIDYQRFGADMDQHPHFLKRLMGAYATKEEYTLRPDSSGHGESNVVPLQFERRS